MAQEESFLVYFDVLEPLEHVSEETRDWKHHFFIIQDNKKARTMKLDQGDVAQEGSTPSSKTFVFVSIICAYYVFI